MPPKITGHMSLSTPCFSHLLNGHYICVIRVLWPITVCQKTWQFLRMRCVSEKNYNNTLMNLRRRFGSGLRILQWTNTCWRSSLLWVILPCVQHICWIVFLNKPFISIASCWVDFATLARATETYIWLGKKHVHVNFTFYLFLLNFDILPGRSINNSQSPWLVHPNNDCWACKTNRARPCPKSRR